jgi:ferric-dicitrate binding protein FerR (iron transport regulator)
MIQTDGKQTIANRDAFKRVLRADQQHRKRLEREDRDWLALIEDDLMRLDRAERERVYAACREHTTSTFEWLACLDGAAS